MLRLILLFSIVALLYSPIAYSKGFSLGAIEDGGCDINDDGSFTQSGWMSKTAEKGEQCVLALIEGDLSHNAPRPRIIIDGEEIELIERHGAKAVERGRTNRQFRSKDGTVSVQLTSWLGHDSCADPDMDGKCCGQRYEGKLVISRSRSTKTVHVHQWHGM